MNYKVCLFFYCQLLFIYSLAICFSSFMIEYENVFVCDYCYLLDLNTL